MSVTAALHFFLNKRSKCVKGNELRSNCKSHEISSFIMRSRCICSSNGNHLSRRNGIQTIILKCSVNVLFKVFHCIAI